MKQEGETINGHASGLWRVFNQNGIISETVNYRNNIRNGESTSFHSNGRIMHVETFENDILISRIEYNFSTGRPFREFIYKNGLLVEEREIRDQSVARNDTIPVSLANRLNLVEFRTGYIETIDVLGGGQSIFTPIVIMRWRNISDNSISETVRIRGLFIDNKNNEELNTSLAFLQGPTDLPLQKNITRQLDVRSSFGFVHRAGALSGDISCQIYINDIFIRSVRIDNIILQTNRL